MEYKQPPREDTWAEKNQKDILAKIRIIVDMSQVTYMGKPARKPVKYKVSKNCEKNERFKNER